jgi:uncharacterized protein
MDDSTLLRLETYNPWLREPSAWPGALGPRLPAAPVARSAILPLDTRRTTLVVGPRQAGKSTLILLRLAEQDTGPLILALDDPLLRGICSSGARFLEAYEQLGRSFCAIVFDEIQHLDEAGLFLKTLIDLRPGVPIIATGSSAYHLRSGTRESLAGRAHRARLLPFSITEALEHAMAAEPAYRQGLVSDATLDRMVLWGGYPDVWLEAEARQRQALLQDLVHAHVLRDASDAHRIRRPEALRRLLRLAASQVGNLVNMSELASLAGIAVSTVDEYLGILEDSHVIARVAPFLGGKRAEITSTPKLFFLDNGLRNSLHGGFAPFGERGDRGALLENLVFTELSKLTGPLDELRFWRTKNGAEVDFVLRRGDRLIAVEVKASALRRPTIPRACRSFLQAYRPDTLIIVNMGLNQTHEVEGVPVRFCKPWALGAAMGD